MNFALRLLAAFGLAYSLVSVRKGLASRGLQPTLRQSIRASAFLSFGVAVGLFSQTMTSIVPRLGGTLIGLMLVTIAALRVRAASRAFVEDVKTRDALP